MTIRWTGIIAGAVLCWPLAGQGGFDGPGQYQIVNLKSGKALNLDRNDQSTVIQLSPRGSDDQVWVIRPAPNGYSYIRNRVNGFALDAGSARRSEPVRGLPFNGGDSQQWRLEPGKDGNALIVSRFGRTLDIPDGTSRDGARVQVYDLNGDSNQRFILRRVSGGRDLDWDRNRDRGSGRDDVGTLTCSSDNFQRVYCRADTRFGVQMVRQISGSPCRQGETWGFDNRGVWVDRGCRAVFRVNQDRGRDGDRERARDGDRDRDQNRDRDDVGRGGERLVTCSSNNGERVYCDAETRDAQVDLVRQISGSPCRQGQTWGWDRRGIWVDRGCRAQFSVRRGR
jgi:Protein of unknown function (DUF3011)/Ricin-type beta-trefoil lectin domain-like